MSAVPSLPETKRRSAAGRIVWDSLVVIHRYLGVALGLLMLVWFVSGIVMMYVPYPQRGETERVAALSDIPWERCCNFAGSSIAAADEVDRIQLENIARRAALRVRQPPGPDSIIDLDSGEPLAIDEDAARAVAAESANRIIGPGTQILSQELIERDQWTVGDNGINRRPVYRFAYDDPARTRLYVSSITGEAFVWTTGFQRFWNWLGAIPHWLYFTELRKNGPLWVDIIIWTSLLGTFLTVIGLYLGIARFRKSKSGRLSPYSGWFYWHHLIGLAFGIIILTWTASGLFSMEPWGFLASEGGEEVDRIPGEPLRMGEVQESLMALRGRDLGDVVSLTSLRLDGRLYWRAMARNGSVRRLDASGADAPPAEAELAARAQLLADPWDIQSAQLIKSEDAYWFRFNGFAQRDPLVLPVYRVILNDPQAIRYYLDPRTGALLRRLDNGGKGYRWLFDGLHRFDFTQWLRTRPLWDIIVLFLMIGGTVGTFTGVWLGIRRIRLDLTFRPKRR
jgi:uncharacterized iron-regulated membrane protein